MKNRIALLQLVVIISLLFAVGDLEAKQYGVEVAVNGVKLELKDQQPYMNGCSIYVPLREVFEDLGYKVEYTPLKMEGVEKIGKVKIVVGEKVVEILAMNAIDMFLVEDSSALIHDMGGLPTAEWMGDRVYVPFRFVGETLGGSVEYQFKNESHIGLLNFK